MIRKKKKAKVIPGRRIETIAPIAATPKSPLSKTYRNSLERTHHAKEVDCKKASFQKVSSAKTASCPMSSPIVLSSKQTTCPKETPANPRQEIPQSAQPDMTLEHLFAGDRLTKHFNH